MQLAHEFGSERFPIRLYDVAQVVVLLPVFGDAMVNLAGHRVEDLLRITVVTNRTEHCLPNVELVSGPAVGAKNKLAARLTFHRVFDNAVSRAHHRSRNFGERTLNPK